MSRNLTRQGGEPHGFLGEEYSRYGRGPTKVQWALGGTVALPGRKGMIGGGVKMGQGSSQAGRALKAAVRTIAQHC